MKRTMAIVIGIILLFTFNQALAKDYEITKKAGDYTVQIKIDKNPPVTGLNKMEVGIKDAGGKDVTDAVVAVEYGMPAMPGMGPMNYKTGTSLKDNRYMASINFSMSGPWFINVKITRTGKTQVVKLNVDVK
ncbi:MAG: FixH family protein [Smithellaceae bacterium]